MLGHMDLLCSDGQMPCIVLPLLAEGQSGLASNAWPHASFLQQLANAMHTATAGQQCLPSRVFAAVVGNDMYTAACSC